MASWFRFVVLSRPVLLQGLQVNTVCGVLVWEGGGGGEDRGSGWGEGGCVCWFEKEKE